jgi:hypothetical protein
MVKRRVGVALLVALMVPGAAFGATKPFEKVGTYAAQFLKIGVSARATAMGNAFTAVANDASAAYWNPAGIVDVPRTQVGLSHTLWPADINLDYASAVFHTTFFPGTFAVSARSLSMDPMIERTVYRPEGTGREFDAGDMAFGVSYSKFFTDRFSSGVTLNFLHLGLADKSVNTTAIDFGLIYRMGIQGVRLGMMIQSLGSEVNFDSRSSKMPTVFKVGLSMKGYEAGAHRVLLSGEFGHPSDNKEHTNLGMEYSFNQFGFLRAGYNFGYDSHELSWGAGMHVDTSQTSSITVDYSWVDMGFLGSVNRFSVGFVF